MTDATLTLDGAPKLDGIIESGGDFIRSLAPADIGTDRLAAAANGTIQIEGTSEKVTLEGSAPGSVLGREGLVLTLRRHTPRVI